MDSSDHNYVYSRTYQTERSVPTAFFTDDPALVQQITYFDGLGRPMQQNVIAHSPQGADIVTHIGYDGFGVSAPPSTS